MLCSGQGKEQSEPSPEQLPCWSPYLTLARGSPWELDWTSRCESVPLLPKKGGLCRDGQLV